MPYRYPIVMPVGLANLSTTLVTVVLMDLLMPVMDGIAATRAIRSELPDIEVLALTSVLEDASVIGAVRARQPRAAHRARD